MKSERERREQYIRANFRLHETSQGWRAIYFGVAQIDGATKKEVVNQARARWGHFNFSDEARAFNEIFPVVHE